MHFERKRKKRQNKCNMIPNTSIIHQNAFQIRISRLQIISSRIVFSAIAFWSISACSCKCHHKFYKLKCLTIYFATTLKRNSALPCNDLTVQCHSYQMLANILNPIEKFSLR